MKIILHDYHGTPHHFDLSKELARRGYTVTHIYNVNSGGPQANFGNKNDSINIIGINGEKVKKDNFVKRYFAELRYGKTLIENVAKLKTDIIISANTPTDPDNLLQNYALKNNIPYLFWLKDIRSLAIKYILAKKLGLLGRAVGNYYIKKEKRLLKRAAHVVSLTDDFLEIMDRWNVKTPTTVIPDWTPIKDFPIHPKLNSFSKQHKLTDYFVILYSGSLGLKHHPEIIAWAANELRTYDKIKFVVISEGVGIDYLNKEKRKLGLENLLLLPFQDYSLLPEVLGSADIILTILDDAASQYCVPSKVWTGYCSSKPALLVAPESNLVSRITKKIEGGIVIPPDDKYAFVAAIKKFYEDNDLRKKCGENVREYAEQNFNVNKIADKFEKIINEITETEKK